MEEEVTTQEEEELYQEDEATVRPDSMPPGESPAERIRARREQIANDDTNTMDLPGFEGLLAARFRRLEYKEIEKIARKHSRSKDKEGKNLKTECLTIALATEEVLSYSPDGELEPLCHVYPEIGEGPVRFDRRLGQALGFDPGDSAVAAVLGCLNNELAVPGLSLRLNQWFERSRQEDAEDEDFGKLS